ncbi:MAG: urate oxidase [Herpetosiphonaceae bacterium]|nr:urate oxidase [Herpetosiphonaceae bacterium]
MSAAPKNTLAGSEIVLGPTNYGKSTVRLVKVIRGPDRHDVRDLTVDVTFAGDFALAYVQGDNSAMLATDTMRNTVYALAPEHLVASIEEFGLILVNHFLSVAPAANRVEVRLVEYPWSRIEVGGVPHAHSFTRSSGEHVAVVSGTRETQEVTAGIDNLLILKTTNSGWENFLHDQYTTLPDADDRILATMLTATWSYAATTNVDFDQLWRGVHDCILTTFTDHYSPSVQHTLYRMGKAVLEAYPAVRKIHFTLPNKHHLVFNLAPFGLENNNEIFHVTTDPYGVIEGTVERRS